MQEIAEYPLMLVFLVLWHYRFTGDREYLEKNYAKVTKLLDAYRRRYEKDGLLRELDKWCVVEWPKNFRHGYDVDILEGKVCHEAHVSINAYYIAAVRAANKMARLLGKAEYRSEKPLLESFIRIFYDREQGLFRDGENTSHISLVGNSFVYAFGLYPDEDSKQKFLEMFDSHGISSLSMFCSFPMLMGMVRDREEARLKNAILNEGAWLRILREGGSTTFEGWGMDTKWNTSLFHMTMSFVSLFIADVDIKKILEI
jgi:glycogen debranching enzyme